MSLSINKHIPIFEVIVIDDCSIDNSYDLLIEYKKNVKYDMKIIKNEKNVGAGEARNIGINYSNGEYLIFVDSDDYIEINTLEILNELFSEDIDCICFDYVKENYKNYKRFSMILDEKFGIIDNQKGDAVYKVRGCTCGKAYKSKIIKDNNIRFANVNRNEDMPFTKIAISYCKKIFYYKEVLYHYVNNEKSLMNDNSKMNEDNCVISFNLIEKNINPKISKNILEYIFIMECYYTIVYISIKKGYSNKKINDLINSVLEKYPNCFDNKHFNFLHPIKKMIFCLMKKRRYFLIRLILNFK